MGNDSEWRTGAWKLGQEERLQVVNWLFSLEFNEMISLARTRLREAFPNAPPEMLFTAEHHLFVDGKDDALLWIAELAVFRKDSGPPSLGCTFMFLHHLYNWWQFRALLPEGKQGIRELVKEIRDLIEEGSPEAALGTLKILEESLDGNLDYPKFDE
jgi:hypothetical protein